MPGDTGRDRGKADGGEGGANDSGDDSGQDNDSGFGDGGYGGYGGMSDADAEAARDAMDAAAAEADALAGWGREYGDFADSPDVADVFGFDRSARGVAQGLANLGLSDQDISEALSNWGAGYAERAALLGPIDAITQGPATRALSSGLTKAVAIASPQAGLLGSLADRAIRGNLTGDYGDLGSTLGGLAGSRFGAMIGGDLSQSIGGALAGLAAGGLAGSAFGRAIGSGQGSMANVSDLSSEGRDNSMRPAMRPQRRPMLAQRQQAPMSPSVALQLLGMRGFGV